MAAHFTRSTITSSALSSGGWCISPHSAARSRPCCSRPWTARPVAAASATARQLRMSITTARPCGIGCSHSRPSKDNSVGFGKNGWRSTRDVASISDQLAAATVQAARPPAVMVLETVAATRVIPTQSCTRRLVQATRSSMAGSRCSSNRSDRCGSHLRLSFARRRCELRRKSSSRILRSPRRRRFAASRALQPASKGWLRSRVGRSFIALGAGCGGGDTGGAAVVVRMPTIRKSGRCAQPAV
mmetsp:Transcript_13507/g.39985  ORF Transcript_13507/g.39985 Transcript_13507/m.39985 type:complete len:243 (-) Transcript_13507:1452-2180(-)